MSHRMKHRATRALAIFAMAGLGGFVALSQRAAADEQEDGRIVAISPQSEDEEAINNANPNEDAPAQSGYWLGIQGQPLQSDVLRTHLQLAADVGVVVEQIVPNSPAEKAGLKRHDVLISVGDEQITDMAVLQQAVAASEGKPVEIKLIRLGKDMKISVTPEERPADLAMSPQNVPGMPGGMQMQMDDLQNMLEQMQRGGLGARVVGPGMILGGRNFNLNQMPGDVEVRISREGDGPAKVTVRRGDESWTVEEGDEEALNKLPEDLRPFVGQMLSGQGGLQGLRAGLQGGFGQFDFNFDEHINAAREQAEAAQRAAQEQMEAARRAADEARVQFQDELRDQLMQRLEQMERRLQQMQEQLEHRDSGGESGDSAAPADPSTT
jgi:membrane-associated protease RseP (regulator of RpoE activity)